MAVLWWEWHGLPGSDVPVSGARILIVDDEPRVLRVLRDMLEHCGHEVICCIDGREAIEIYRRECGAIDCVLLDLSMPGLSGDEVFVELRRIRGDVRVILSSGFTEQEVMDRFHGAGLAGVIQKPARMKVLQARISEALSREPVVPGRI